MANALKLIIPLLDNSLTLNDLSENVGFKNAYLEDINRPYLVNHVFLLYDGKLDTSDKIDRDEKLRKIKSLYSRQTIYINNIAYLLYIFVILNKSILRVRDCNFPCKKEDMTRIMLFWELKDSFINDVMIKDNVSITLDGTILPEEDYIPSLEEEIGDLFL